MNTPNNILVLLQPESGQLLGWGDAKRMEALAQRTPAKLKTLRVSYTSEQLQAAVKSNDKAKQIFKDHLLSQTAPPLTELRAAFPRAGIGINPQGKLRIIDPLNPDEPKTMEWAPQQNENQQQIWNELNRTNEKDRLSEKAADYLRFTEEAAAVLEKRLRQLDKDRIAQMQLVYGPIAAQLDPGAPTVKPVRPNTPDQWAALEKAVNNPAGMPAEQKFSVTYPGRNSVTMRLDNKKLQENPNEAIKQTIHQVNTPEQKLEEAIGRDPSLLHRDQITDRLYAHFESTKTPEEHQSNHLEQQEEQAPNQAPVRTR